MAESRVDFSELTDEQLAAEAQRERSSGPAFTALVERFRENRDVYCSSVYNEAQGRREFIDPLVHEKSLIQRQIDTTGKQIDRLVYELYGLTDDEIRIVEEGR